MNVDELIAAARKVVGEFTPSDDCIVGGVAAALLTVGDNVYTGICIDTACSLGFCAEHAAIADMLKAHESEIRLIVAVRADGTIVCPCGRCRELMWQVSPRNAHAHVVLAADRIVPLSDLLP